MLGSIGTSGSFNRRSSSSILRAYSASVNSTSSLVDHILRKQILNFWERNNALGVVAEATALADLQEIVEAGRGDVPLTELRFRCSQCGTDRTDFVVTSRDVVKPW